VYKAKIKGEIQDQELVQEQVHLEDQEADQDQEQVLEEEEYKIKEIFLIINKVFQVQ
jgi:hypothetical protein